MQHVHRALRQIMGELAALRADHAELRARHERLHRYGAVTDIDGSKHRVRIQIANASGTAQKSPWIPYSQIAGNRRVHSMPSKGQQVCVVCPDGDFDNAHCYPLIWSNKITSPSTDPDTDIDTRGDVTTTQTKDTHTLAVKDVTTVRTKGTYKTTAKTSFTVKSKRIDLNPTN